MNKFELYFDHPWLLLLILPAVALVLIPFFRTSSRHRKAFRRMAPMVLHCLMAVLLVLIMAGTAITRSSDSQAVMLVLDLSDSTLGVRQEILDTAKTLESEFKRGVVQGVVAFGDDCVYAVAPDDSLSPVRTDATDIGETLQYAHSRLPSDRAGRIILISDGKQTDGNADAMAQYLSTQSVRIDAVCIEDTAQSPEIQIDNFSAPEGCYRGQELSFSVELYSNIITEGTLVLYDNETEVDRLSRVFPVGNTAIEMTAPAVTEGSHLFRVTLEAEKDTIPQNNTAYAHVEAADRPSVLIITGVGADASELAGLLGGTNRVTVQTTAKSPRTLTALCDYDGVILLNVNGDDLPKNFPALLESYVRIHGRSLLAVGGTDTFMYGSMRNTTYEEMMPVSLTLSRSNEKDSVALMLVMDCSLSMSQQSAFMSVAKQGAIKCVDSMSDNDYVGIISFNNTAVVEAPLGKNTEAHKTELNRIISRLTTSQGTYYTDALALAHQELLASSAPIKHILFVSDGGPADTTYTDLLPGIAADGISISTIGLGFSSTLLEEMAENGGGAYYYVSDSSELPNIMLSLTEQITVNSLITGQFAAQATADSGFGSLPAVNGYLGTTLKKGAEAPVTLGTDAHPLFARWQYGAGTVAVFTSDLAQGWCSLWLETLEGREAIGSMVKQVLPDIHRDSLLRATFTPKGTTADLTLETFSTNTDSVTVTTADGTYTLLRAEPGVYTATIPIPGMGACPLVFTQADNKGATIDTLKMTPAVSYSAEYDAFAESGRRLLETLCLSANGMVTEDLAQLTDVRLEAISVVTDFTVPFAIVLAVCFLVDITIRKIRWKDIKSYLLQWKYGK